MVRINDETYDIKFVAKFDDLDTVGECCPESRTIRIKRGLDPQERLKTYIHEVLHSMEFEFDIKIKHKTIYALEEAIFDFFIKN